MGKKSFESHIKADDYFGVLARFRPSPPPRLLGRKGIEMKCHNKSNPFRLLLAQLQRTVPFPWPPACGDFAVFASARACHVVLDINETIEVLKEINLSLRHIAAAVAQLRGTDTP
jgi:hypothetical protein